MCEKHGEMKSICLDTRLLCGVSAPREDTWGRRPAGLRATLMLVGTAWLFSLRLNRQVPSRNTLDKGGPSRGWAVAFQNTDPGHSSSTVGKQKSKLSRDAVATSGCSSEYGVPL